MALTSRLFVAGAVVVAAATAPTITSLTTPQAGTPDRPMAACLAWLGSMNDGTCISYSNSGGAGGASGGVPQISVGGPNSGSPGLSSGPLFPGSQINVPLTP